MKEQGAGSAEAGPAFSLPGWAGLPAGPAVMGILNVTPDSFSDGGLHLDVGRAVAAGLRMIADGAAILDIGGESTRPGSAPVPPGEERRRVVPVVAALAGAGVPLSVDTRNADTMAAALDAGATAVNDVSALSHDPLALPLAAARGCPVVLMHMRGTPATMTGLTGYGDIVGEVLNELAARVAAAENAGIRRANIAVDPGIGFAKTSQGSVALLRSLSAFRTLGCPILVGASRKGFIGQLSGVADPADRAAGSIAAGLYALSQGANILRVHDVAAMVQAVRVWQGLAG